MLAIVVAVLVYSLVAPVEWVPLGQLAGLALMFPLHFLLVTVLAVIAVFLAWKFSARIAVAAFSGIAVTTVFIALIP